MLLASEPDEMWSLRFRRRWIHLPSGLPINKFSDSTRSGENLPAPFLFIRLLSLIKLFLMRKNFVQSHLTKILPTTH